jgi:hypothetical protein
VNELPKNIDKNIGVQIWLNANKFTTGKDGKTTGKDGKKLLVYGLQWQRMIIFYLLHANKWVLLSDAAFGGNRAEQLTKLLERLEVRGIALEKK